MKIIHFSDTHLGFSAYRKITKDGINQREIDIYESFKQVVDYAVEKKPDLIIHAGDLFDSVRPNNRAINFALKQIIRLSKKDIPIVIISGNHEHPKLKETGHIFSIFDHLENVYPVYKEEYEKIDFKIKKEKICVHAIPQSSLKSKFEEELKKIKPSENFDYNILTAHGAVTGIQAFSMNEFNELFIPAETLSKDFDYIALGHYHNHTKLSDNAYYSGSTEHLSFTEANSKKGFMLIDLKKQKTNVKFVEIKTRPMVDAEAIKCTNLRLEQIMDKIKKTVKEINPKKKTFRIKLEDISPKIYRNLDFGEIRKISSDAVHYEIKADIKQDEELKKTDSSKINKLASEFEQFLKKQGLEDSNTILELGISYIDKIEAREEGK